MAFQVSCLDARIQQALVEIAEQYGWEDSGGEWHDNWLLFEPNGKFKRAFAGPDVEAIHVDEAIPRLMKGPALSKVTLELTSDQVDWLRTILR